MNNLKKKGRRSKRKIIRRSVALPYLHSTLKHQARARKGKNRRKEYLRKSKWRKKSNCKI